jgi:hypothetical protein
MRFSTICIVCALLLAAAPVALGDVFILTNGGRIEGELANPDEKPRRTYEVQMAGGGRVTLEAAQVEKVVTVRADQHEYERIRHQYPDTVEGQWALAQWCLQQRLLSQRDTHLERVIELDPNHAEARRALGYSQVDGKWAKRDEVMISRGYVLYKGRWRTRQEIELIENKRKQELAEKEWFQKIDRWRGWFGTDKGLVAQQNIQGIEDPLAVKGLAAALTGKKREPAPVRGMFIEALAKIGTPDALQVLAATALEDDDREVRLTCLDYLQKKKNPDVISYFVSKLRSKDNSTVNTAAVALGRLKDPSAVGPLIGALITTHKFKVAPKGGGGPGSMSSTFGNGPGAGGMSVGDSTKIYTQQMANQPVLDALVVLTGQNFNFDVQAWKYWYATQKRTDPLDARRN